MGKPAPVHHGGTQEYHAYRAPERRSTGCGKPGKFTVNQLRMTVRYSKQFGQYGFCAVQGIQQPEQRHISHGEIGKPGIAFPTHGHQPLTAGLKTMQ